jgi:AraC-like DNA-binding protein
MILAKTLLQSGNFYSMTDVVYELNYTKLNYFSMKYFEVFNRKPLEDFVKECFKIADKKHSKRKWDTPREKSLISFMNIKRHKVIECEYTQPIFF